MGILDRTGEKNINHQNEEMTIIQYTNNRDILVKFNDGTVVNTTYYYFKNGSVINNNIPTYLGVGYLGYGIYNSRVNNKKTEAYIKWSSMLTRCYSPIFHERQNYEGCNVCEEWLCFQNFAQWFYENKYDSPDQDTLHLDKDILIKNNKIYSPETCLLVPRRINSIILNRHNDRSKILLGVYQHNGKYVAATNKFDKSDRYIGTFDTKEEAFNAYKKIKEEEILKAANHYKPYIPQKVYDAIINYKIDITD